MEATLKNDLTCDVPASMRLAIARYLSAVARDASGWDSQLGINLGSTINEAFTRNEAFMKSWPSAAYIARADMTTRIEQVHASYESNVECIYSKSR